MLIQRMVKKREERIARNFEQYRRPSESLVAAFPANSRSHVLLIFANALAMQLLFRVDGWSTVVVIAFTVALIAGYLLVNTAYLVIATNERTVLARSSQWDTSRVGPIVETLSEHEKMGPPSGLINCKVRIFERVLKTHWRFFDEIRRADAR